MGSLDIERSSIVYCIYLNNNWNVLVELDNFYYLNRVPGDGDESDNFIISSVYNMLLGVDKIEVVAPVRPDDIKSKDNLKGSNITSNDIKK